MSIKALAMMTTSSNSQQQQQPAQHICVLYVATAGVQGPLMGSDEQEIVLLIYIIIDILQNRVVGIQQYPVLPRVADQLLAQHHQQQRHHPQYNASSASSTSGGVDALDSSYSSERSASSPALPQSVITAQTSATVFSSAANTATSISAIIGSVTAPNITLNNSGNNNVSGHNNAGMYNSRNVVGGGTEAGVVVVADLNENSINILSEQLRDESILTDELIKSSGRKLEVVLEEFTQYCTSLNVDPHHPGFRLVTDGQLPIRQCLYPEAYRKDIELPFYYKSFYDLRKEVAKFCASKGQSDDVPLSVEEMLTYVQLKPECENEFYKKEAKDMVNIVQKLIKEDHRFDTSESVTLVLEPGICSKDDEIDGNCIVRARGLPWQSSDQDIAKFFKGLNVAKGGVALCLSPMGRRNGEALVRFESQEHRDLALKRHKHHMGNRYIEVYRANGEDFLAVAGGASCEALAFLSRGAAVIIRMRGLPYDCVAKQVLDFFAAGENACTVLDGTDGVLFVRKQDGRATGDAFVLFANEFDAPKALSKHRESIGSRYIELFRSTTAEVQQVLNRSMDPKTFEQQFPTAATCSVLQPLPQLPLLPQHVITSGTRKDCVRLRGLPYEALVEHILDFLGDYAKNIIFQGVHMVYNAQGQPSGEAFIQMDSEQSAFTTAHQKHHRYMIFGKKQRYIEVFQCSGDDMNLVLTGGMPASVTSPVKASPAGLLSPGNGLITTGAFGHGAPVPAVGAPFNTYGPSGPAAPPGTHASHSSAGGGPRPPPPPTAFYPHSIFYWPYPSPPVSPTGAYAYGGMPPPPHARSLGPPPGAPVPAAVMATALQHTHQTHQQLIPADCISIAQITAPYATTLDGRLLTTTSDVLLRSDLQEESQPSPFCNPQFLELYI